jgi:flavin reductase (DIM6/NTAB) family NADH-FMN oxidoreductase RutF
MPALQDSPPDLEQRLRDVAGRFATGVTIVTTKSEGTVHGMTANGFMSVSLRPPLVAVSIGNAARMKPLLDETGRYAVSILASEQRSLSRHFAGQPGETAPTFLEAGDMPLLEGALAHIAVSVVDAHPAGDHTIYIGRVEHLDYREGQPLVFHAGGYRALEPALRWWDTWYREAGWT